MSHFQILVPRHCPKSPRSPITALPSVPALAGLAMALSAVACGTNNTYYETQYVYPAQGDAGAPNPTPPDPDIDAGVPTEPVARPDAGHPDPDPDAGAPGEEEGLPEVNTVAQALAVDVFGQAGNRFWFVVSDAELERMNERYLGGGFPGGGFFGGDIYTPGGGAGDVTFVDRLLVSTAGVAPDTADFGKVQVSLVGESTGRPWTTDSLPNFKIDSDEFTEGNRVGGVKHFRLNNAIVGSIFREKLTLDLYAKLHYPAPRASYAWVSSSVWGPDIAVPYVVVESYKPQFCKQREAELSGGCVNMWEFAGDLGHGLLGYPENCQFSECDPTRALEFELDAVDTPLGPGYKEALSEWLDWDSFHRFQCLSWILATGDDVLHNTNNFVMVERADGKFQHLPYSIDISLGQEWYPEVPLAGGSRLAQGCQSDPQCWDDTIATCEVLLDEFAAANPIAMLDQNYTLLSAQGMLRGGDEGRYKALSSYLARRLEELPLELEQNREAPPPSGGFCEFPYIQCVDFCALPEECFLCQPGEEPVPGEGVDAGEGAEAEPRAEVNVADIAVPPPGGGVEEPIECVVPIEIYGGPGRPIFFR